MNDHQTLVALFPDEHAARWAVGALRAAEIPPERVSISTAAALGSTGVSPELDEPSVVIGRPPAGAAPATSGRARFAVAAGSVVGALLLLPLAAFSLGDLSFAARIALVLLAGSAVGAVAGALTATARAASHEVHEAGGVSVIMRGDDRELDLAAAVLVQWAPTRLERFGPAEEPTA